MLKWMRELLQRRYLREIEEELSRARDEVERLRGENRALLNSLLGTAGFPPVEFPTPAAPRELPRLRRRSWHQFQWLKQKQSERENPS